MNTTNEFYPKEITANLHAFRIPPQQVFETEIIKRRWIAGKFGHFKTPSVFEIAEFYSAQFIKAQLISAQNVKIDCRWSVRRKSI